MQPIRFRNALPNSAHTALAPHSERLRRLLFYRGIEDNETAERFLFPNYDSDLHDPLLLADMEKAVERIVCAIENNEWMVLYSDYDADGIPGAVVMHDILKRLGFKNFSVYIPHRNTEGFGLNAEAVDSFARDGVTLIVTIDCGTADALHIARAKEKGIDVIVTDHHLPRLGALPESFAFVNPNRPDDAYPFKHLCGAAVAYKLAQALVAHLRRLQYAGVKDIPLGWEKWLLDMVGIATLSDMVPLIGENRVLARYGLSVMRKTKRVGFQQLLRRIGVFQKNITEDDITFMVTPRINAASRMDAPEDAFNALAAQDAAQAGTLAEHLNTLNEDRKSVISTMVKEIRHRLAELERLAQVIVMGNPLWRPGLLGLAANTIMEAYERPVFLWGRDGQENNVIKGSCRSDGSVNVMHLMEESADLFLEYGGHKHSGGFSVSHEKVHMLESGLNEAYTRTENQKQKTKNEEGAWVDDVVHLDEVNWNTYRDVEALAPFGMENHKPLFLFEKILVASVERFGKTKNHAKLNFENAKKERISAIQFFVKEDEPLGQVKAGDTIDLLATMEKSTFGSTPEVRLRIVDIG